MDVSERENFVRKPRQRAVPLFPIPFKECRKTDAKSWNVFTPDLNVLKYKETLSKDQEKNLHDRAENLVWRAVGAEYYRASEFYWEICAWHDIFNLIHTDEKFRVDKRPYRFVEPDSNGKLSVLTRILDATFGIKTFFNLCNRFGFPAYRSNAKKEPEPLLCKDDLHYMTLNPRCSLIVDGVWGEAGLIFPFAAYEAKSGRHRYDGSAEKQVQHACQTYLAMLDDLARDPNNVTEYLTKESSQFQFFAFTSSASFWEVHVAWSSLEECMMQTIWKGDVRKYSEALQLIYIVDQVHDFAIKQHYPFVLKHLEAWFARDRQFPLNRGLWATHPDMNPPWLVLERESRTFKQEKAREAREARKTREGRIEKPKPSKRAPRKGKGKAWNWELLEQRKENKEVSEEVITMLSRPISISPDSD
ncbi:hypothetical protein TsFJ059_009253 [Trichoderma semiorbis]|uniref:Uncharacterized protein n=1 Tax=Trichoderma semiorbis TaxID=1491008 RepID=A0A9P8HQI7_9HYPO|nr:hypothetical protein TsFJ059_009253 [Trichoderma semiorbis]